MGLDRGIAMVPLSEALLREIHRSSPPETGGPSEVVEALEFLTPAIERWARELSLGSAVAYVETEYFGGVAPVGGTNPLNSLSYLRHRAQDRLSVAFVTGEKDFNRRESEEYLHPLLTELGAQRVGDRLELDATAPAAPTMAEGGEGNSAIPLQWDAPAGEVNEYRIYVDRSGTCAASTLVAGGEAPSNPEDTASGSTTSTLAMRSALGSSRLP